MFAHVSRVFGGGGGFEELEAQRGHVLCGRSAAVVVGVERAARQAEHAAAAGQ